MIQYQNEIIIKTLIRIFDNRKIEYENEKIAAEEARKKSEEARKKAEEARKKAEKARKKADAQSENMKNHFINYINVLLDNSAFNPNNIK
jgi:hypothetical protein